MFDIYPWLKVLHILLAIVAVGSNITYPSYIGLGIVGVLLVARRSSRC